MEFTKVLQLRQSTRRFVEEQLSKEQLDALLAAAELAPVGSAMYKDIHLTVVQDQALLLRLCQAAWARFSTREKIQEVAGDVDDGNHKALGSEKPNLFYGAPTVIFVSHRKQSVQPGIEWANASIVAHQMHLAATDMGLGSCYMWGALESMRMLPELDNSEELRLPPDFEPLIGLAVGIPLSEPEMRAARHAPLSINYL